MKRQTVRGRAKATGKSEQTRRRRVKAKTRRNNRNRRGGSTTEQIGAAAQMRAFMPFLPEGHHPVRQALNDIVHHEAHNRFNDPAFNYDPEAQKVINKAYHMTVIGPEIKAQLLIAKRKAENSAGLSLPCDIQQQVQSEDFPDLPVLPNRLAQASYETVPPAQASYETVPPAQASYEPVINVQVAKIHTPQGTINVNDTLALHNFLNFRRN